MSTGSIQQGVNRIASGQSDGLREPISRRTAGISAASLTWHCAMALFFVGMALASTLLLRGLFPYPFLFLFFAAVMASAWFGGTTAGLLAVLASTIAVDYYFVSPYYSFNVNATDSTYFAAFIACALVASWISASKKRDEEAIRDARDQLEFRVAERTAELQTSNRDLLKAQAELDRLSRVLTMGELTASIAHEVNQPLTAVVAYGQACLEWLSAQPPNLDEARQSAERMVQDGTRAGAVLGRIRSLFEKDPPTRTQLDMNEAIVELLAFITEDAARNRIAIRTELSPDLPPITGDRVRLQQVVLNLVMNGMDAMRGASHRPKELWIVSQKKNEKEIAIRVEDTGGGFSPEIAEKIFDPFFTTKPQGIGMGLSISRSIVESHNGRLWAAARPSGGALFQFTLPIGSRNGDA